MASRAVTVGILIVILVAVVPWLWKIYSNNLPSIIPLAAVLGGTHLERANLSEVHLEDADLFEAATARAKAYRAAMDEGPSVLTRAVTTPAVT